MLQGSGEKSEKVVDGMVAGARAVAGMLWRWRCCCWVLVLQWRSMVRSGWVLKRGGGAEEERRSGTELRCEDVDGSGAEVARIYRIRFTV